jgi:hypothetical protein
LTKARLLARTETLSCCRDREREFELNRIFTINGTAPGPKAIAGLLQRILFCSQIRGNEPAGIARTKLNRPRSIATRDFDPGQGHDGALAPHPGTPNYP